MYKYDVFISYSWSEKNRTLVDDLYNYLSQNGVVPWKVDADDVDGLLESQILAIEEEGIRDSKFVLVCPGDTYFESANGKRQLDYAYAQNKNMTVAMLDESYTIPESLQDEDFDWVGVLTNQIYADDKERVFTRVLHGVSGVAGMRGNKKETLISGINRHDFAYYRSQLGGPWLNIGHNGVTAKQSISTIAAGPEGIFGLSARNNLFVMNEFKEWTKLPWYSEHKCANISTGGTFVAALLTTGDIYLMSDFLYGSDISYKWSIITGGKFRHIVLSPDNDVVWGVNFVNEIMFTTTPTQPKWQKVSSPSNNVGPGLQRIAVSYLGVFGLKYGNLYYRVGTNGCPGNPGTSWQELKCPDVIKSISTGSRSLCIITKDENIYIAKDLKFNILGKITSIKDTKNWKKNWTHIEGYLKQIHVYDPMLRY